MASVGGAIWDPKGNLVNSFAWGLGQASNNQAEGYALYQGILLTNKDRINSLTIIGDSSTIISFMVSKTSPSNRKIASIVARVQKEIEGFHKISFHQVLRELKSQADMLANKAVNYGGIIWTKDGWIMYPIPF